MRRRSVITWSLRERPVWSFLPASPMRRVSADSMFMWTSSSAGFHSKLPASISASMLCSPATIDARSASLSTPTRASMVACAMEPAMSWR